MSRLSSVGIFFREFLEPSENPPPRVLEEEDRAAWETAQDRRHLSNKPQTVEAVRELIRNRNPARWACLQRDVRWAKKEMKKMGLNPEDVRYVL